MNFDDGYIGFQEQSNGKKVIIFSIWDPVAHGDNPQQRAGRRAHQTGKAG